jgi:hypothetical protein
MLAPKGQAKLRGILTYFQRKVNKILATRTPRREEKLTTD